MVSKSAQRRLAAILSADIVGYSSMMERDEAGTLDRLKAIHNAVIDPATASHGGRIVKTMGDGFLAEFPSAVSAVNFAIALQSAVTDANATEPEDQKLRYRVGINLGDVIIDGDDIFGDGVNLAARLEALCDPGSLCISNSVHEQVVGKVDATFDDLGEQSVKNIARPVRVYRLAANSVAETKTDPVLGLPDKPSIAVLPFDNLSGDTAQDYFSDGITEDLITALSQISWFFVIARNSCFTYKGRSVDVRDVAKELGVRYVVEGSVRKAGDRIRLTAQLIDGQTGSHVWATRYDRNLEDIFAVQDELTETIVGAIEPELSKAEQQRARLKKPDTLDMWDLYQRGMAALNALTSDSLTEAEAVLTKVVGLDPGFAAAYAGLAEIHYYNVVLGLAADPDAARRSASEFGRRAAELDREDARTLCSLGRALLVSRNFAEAVAEFQAALRINPSHALAHYGIGAAGVFGGNTEISLAHLEQAIRLSPQDANMGSFLVRSAQAHLYLGNFDAAADCARQSLRLPNFQWSRHMILASALGHLGETEAARAALAPLLEKIPHFSARYVLDYSPMVDNDDFKAMFEGLEKAGLRRAD